MQVQSYTRIPPGITALQLIPFPGNPGEDVLNGTTGIWEVFESSAQSTTGQVLDRVLKVFDRVLKVFESGYDSQRIFETKGEDDGEAEDGDDYYKKGRPEGGNPKEDMRLRKDTADVKSEDFKELLEGKGETPSKWKKVMETWETPDGDIYERHYWTNGTDSYYHN